MAEHLTFNQRVRGSNPLRVTILCGCSSMVELQPSKLTTWVRFPSPAPTYEQVNLRIDFFNTCIYIIWVLNLLNLAKNMLNQKGFQIRWTFFFTPKLAWNQCFLICGFLLKSFWKSKARLFKETWLWTIFKVTFKKWIKWLFVKSTERSWWFIWKIGWRI